MNIWDITVEAGLGVVVCEEADILELPAEDVDKEDYAFRLGAILWCGHVSLEVVDGFDLSGGCSAMHGA